MLKKISSEANHRQARRWFMGSDLNLLIWYQKRGAEQNENADNIISFELSDHSATPVALKWRAVKGLTWHRIDDGESRPQHHKSSPLCLQQPLDHDLVNTLLNRLLTQRGELDHETYNHIHITTLNHLKQNHSI